MHKVSVFLGAAIAILASDAAAQSVSMDQVPAAAKAAALYAAGVELTEVGLDLNGGQATYEFKGKSAEGRQVEVDVLADGKVLEIEQEISQDELPPRILDAAKQYLPNFEPQFIERSMRTGDVVAIYYEMEGAGANGNAVDVEVYQNGGLVTIQQDVAF